MKYNIINIIFSDVHEKIPGKKLYHRALLRLSSNCNVVALSVWYIRGPCKPL